MLSHWPSTSYQAMHAFRPLLADMHDESKKIASMLLTPTSCLQIIINDALLESNPESEQSRALYANAIFPGNATTAQVGHGLEVLEWCADQLIIDRTRLFTHEVLARMCPSLVGPVTWLSPFPNLTLTI